MMSVLCAIAVGAMKIPVFAGRGLKVLTEFALFMVVHSAMGLVAVPTYIRRFNSYFDLPYKKLDTWNWTAMFSSVPLFVIIIVPLMMMTVSGHRGQTDLIKLYQYIPYCAYILYGLLATNALSLCYELGRKPSEAAKSEAKKADPDEVPADGVSDFMTMLDSICGFETISPTQASELYRRIIDLLGEQKVTPNEAKRLHDHVQNGVRADIA